MGFWLSGLSAGGARRERQWCSTSGRAEPVEKALDSGRPNLNHSPKEGI